MVYVIAAYDTAESKFAAKLCQGIYIFINSSGIADQLQMRLQWS